MKKLKVLNVVNDCPERGSLSNIDRCLHRHGKDKPCEHFVKFVADNSGFNKSEVHCRYGT